MANLLLLHTNRTDEATLSSETPWQAPLANLQSRFLRRVARSRGVDLEDTRFTMALPQRRSVRGVVIVNNNLTTLARYRIRGSRGGVERYDSGWLDVYPRTKSWREMRWGDPNFWSGRPSEEDLFGFTRSLIHVLPETTDFDTIAIELDDRNNPAGFVELGRLFVASGAQPSHNYSYGGSLGIESRTRIDTSRTGVKFYDRREPARVMRFALEHLPEQEGLERWLEIQRRMGIDGEVFVIPDPDDLLNMIRRAFLGTLRALDPWTQTSFLRAAISFEIEEIL